MKSVALHSGTLDDVRQRQVGQDALLLVSARASR